LQQAGYDWQVIWFEELLKAMAPIPSPGGEGWADICHNLCSGLLVNHPRIAAVEHLLQITRPRTLDSKGLLLFYNPIICWPLDSP
jgi:hypothetical protein